MNRPIQATIVTQNLKENLFQVKKIINQSAIWAVIKANAYGHTINAAFKAFSQADGLALLDLQQVHQLRSLGWSKKILLLEGIFSPQEIPDIISTKSAIVVHQFQQLAWIEEYFIKLSPKKKRGNLQKT
jgi:alanine racemase